MTESNNVAAIIDSQRCCKTLSGTSGEHCAFKVCDLALLVDKRTSKITYESQFPRPIKCSYESINKRKNLRNGVVDLGGWSRLARILRLCSSINRLCLSNGWNYECEDKKS